MPLEPATYISDLVPTNPAATDSTNQGDDHLRLIKSALKTSFAGVTAPVTRASGSGPGFVAGDGTAAAPSYSFASEGTLGFWRSSAATVTLNGNLAASGNFGAVNISASGNLTAGAAISAASGNITGTLGATTVNATTVNAGTVVGALPAGAIMDFAGPTPPAGWIACDGAAISRTSYAQLFANIGGTWGAGDGSTTFNVPNFINRFRRHRDNGGTSGVVGTLQASQNQSHNHTYSGSTGTESVNHSHSMNFTSGAADRDHSHTFSGTTGSMNRSNPHTHPYSHAQPNTSTTGGGGFGIMSSLQGDTTGATDINHEHAYSGTTSGFSTNHFHNISGTTSTESAAHSHAFSGTTSGGSADGAEARPLSATVLTCIKAFN